MNNTKPLTEAKKQHIIEDILDSIIADKEVDSARIARKRRVSVNSVAGVRSNFTRGRYGELKKMVTARKKALRDAG